MKEDLVTGDRRGMLEKDRVPSGRLIIRKKGNETSTGVFYGKQKLFDSKKENKRKRLILTDSESDSDKDVLVSPRRKVICGTGRDSDGSAAPKKSSIEYSKRNVDFETDRKKNGLEPIKRREDGKFGLNRFAEDENKRKRSKLDVFEYADDPIADSRKLGKAPFDGDAIGTGGHSILSSKVRKSSGGRKELGNDGSRSIRVEKREKTVFDRTGGLLIDKERGADRLDKQNKFEAKRDGTFHPVGVLREKSRDSGDGTIRLPGKNGVLKVMIKNKKVVGSGKPFSYHEAEENGNDSESGDNSSWKTPRHPLHLKNKLCDEPDSFVTKNQLNLRKFSSAKSKKACDWKMEDSDTSSKSDSKEMDKCSSKKVVKGIGNRTLKDEILPSTRREKREKRSGTEKQLLRNRIRDMLVSAGWTIDCRPRRNRNYLDSVYISPAGTAYWSIVNAYEALKKEYEENCGSKSTQADFLFSPIPDEVLRKLTRQTRKKMEKEMKKELKINKGSKSVKETTKKKCVKNKHIIDSTGRSKDGEKLSSFIKETGKSMKERIKNSDVPDLKVKGLAKGQKSTQSSKEVDDTETMIDEASNLGAISLKGMPKPVRVQKPPFASHAHMLQGKKNKKPSRCALLVRGSKTGLNPDGDDFIPYSGKRTVLSWLIDSGIVPLSGKVQYKNKRRTKVMLEGWITRDGIHCGCCSKILTVSKFEIHAGSKLRQPFQNILLETGISLFQCQLDAWNRQEDRERCGFHFVDFDGDDPNDDTCGLCGDGGDLICCDGCPSTFHQSCLGIQMLPAGDWHCPNCSCKCCGGVDGSTAQDDPVTLLKCSSCEKKFHQLCNKEMDVVPADSSSPHSFFCGNKCKQLFEQLQKLLGVKHEVESGFSWTLIQRSDLDSEMSPRVLPQRAECNSKLAVALAVMDECFLPIVDRRSGINLIRNVLYNCGSNFNRLNYSGFYTFVLERGDEIISAASVRIHGTRLAEMPFIGTRDIYRRQGMCRRLLNAIELVLCSLNVEKLIIPAISELMHTWTVVFGFEPLEELHKHEMRSMNMLVFPGTDLLQKFIPKYDISEGNVNAAEVVEPVVVQSGDLNRHSIAMVSDIGCPAEPDVSAYDECVVRDAQVGNEVAAVGSGFQDTGGSSHDTSYVMQGPLDGPAGPDVCVSDDDVVCDNKVKRVEVASVRSGFKDISGLSQDAFDVMCDASDDPGNAPLQAFRKRNMFCNSQETAIDSTSLLHSVPAQDELVKDNKPLLDSSITCTTQSSSEGERDVSHEVKFDVAGTKPYLCSLGEISGKQTTNTTEYQNVISSSNFVATAEIIHASGCGTSDVCDVKTEITASDPHLHYSVDGVIHQSAAVKSEAQDAASVHCSQVSSGNVVCHLSEDTSQICLDNVQPLSALSHCNFQGTGESLLHQDSKLQESTECSCDATFTITDAQFSMLGKDSFNVNSKCHVPTFGCRSFDTSGSESVVTSVIANPHGFCEALVHYSSPATSEPRSQALSQSNGLCKSEPVHSSGQSVTPRANTCSTTYFELNHWDSTEDNVCEDASGECNYPSPDGGSFCGKSGIVNKSLASTEHDPQVSHVDVMQHSSEFLYDTLPHTSGGVSEYDLPEVVIGSNQAT
ncbi:hypothetical protein NE237_015418 [Protea cynaroides]|uniref:PHD-type domain-containing protein n=1 Tax=Protea cynaroides TaxID=273540 RepID=A0A9Q0KDY9_9MAGN|nr:hypothetical protein NE237_015418 [Protea cynaroides]